MKTVWSVFVLLLSSQALKLSVAAIAVGLSVSGTSYGKTNKYEKVRWKDVQVVEAEPKGCTFIDKIDVDSGTWMTFSGKGFRKKAERKLKKKAGKLGSNVVYVTKELMIGTVMNREANAYRCS